MAIVRTDDTTGVTPAFWTPSIPKAADDGEAIEDGRAAEDSRAAEDGEGPERVGEPSAAPDTPEPPDGGASEALTAPDDGTEPDTANSTADTQLLRTVADIDLPVFLDTTGRRRRRVRALLWLVSLAGLTYATVLVFSLLGGHGAQSLTGSEYRPGEKPSPPATGAPAATADAELTRPTVDTGQASAADSDPPARLPRSSSSAVRPSSATSTPSTPAPSTSEAAPSPSPSGGALDGLLDTLFPWAS